MHNYKHIQIQQDEAEIGADWQPSAKCQLLCKQLGLRISDTVNAVEQYRALNLPLQDESYLLWLGEYLKRQGAHIDQNCVLLPLDWRPDQALYKHLLARGFPDYLINFHVEAFVMQQRETRQIEQDWGKAYEKYLRKHCGPEEQRITDVLQLQGYTRRQLAELESLYLSLPASQRPSFEHFCERMR